MIRPRNTLLGLGFVVVVVALVMLSVLAYRKAFTPVVGVTLQADHTGLQLNEGADVKLRGVVVGEVRHIAADGEKASLQLALDPATVAFVPSNVEARLLPRTLFGEKFVDLVVPTDASPEPIANGAVIEQDRSRTGVELERVIDESLPLLRAIRPEALAATLSALAYALDGRGTQLGADIDTATGVLTQLNIQMPTIAADVHKLVTVVNTYDGAASDILAILRNITVTMDTIASQRTQLAEFLADSTEFADTATEFLQRNGDQIIRLGQVSRPVLNLLATYAPEYPCLLAGAVALEPTTERVFVTGQMHITLEMVKDQGKYVAGRDDPEYAAHDGPNCRGLPSPTVPFPGARVDDGYGGNGTPVSMGIAGTSEEQDVVRPIVAKATGVRVDQVPDIAVLLWGPLLRGTAVSVP